MRRATALTLTLLGILGCGGLIQIYVKRTDSPVAPLGASSTGQLGSDRIPEATAAHTTQSRQLLEKVARLEARIDRLARQATPNTVPTSSSVNEPPSLTHEERMERNQSRIRRIDKALDSEPHDGRWSSDTSRVLEDLFVSLVPVGSSLSETTCGETFCRLVVKHESRKARNEFEVFPRKVPSMGVRGLIEENEDGSSKTTLYVVRKEYDTPEHPVRLQDSTG